MTVFLPLATSPPVLHLCCYTSSAMSVLLSSAIPSSPRKIGSLYSPVSPPPSRTSLVVVFLPYISCAVPLSSMQSIDLVFLLVSGDRESLSAKASQRTKAPPPPPTPRE